MIRRVGLLNYKDDYGKLLVVVDVISQGQIHLPFVTFCMLFASLPLFVGAISRTHDLLV